MAVPQFQGWTNPTPGPQSQPRRESSARFRGQEGGLSERVVRICAPKRAMKPWWDQVEWWEFYRASSLNGRGQSDPWSLQGWLQLRELKQSYLAYKSADFLKQPALQLLSNHSKGWGHNLQDLKQPETWTIPRCGGNPVKISPLIHSNGHRMTLRKKNTGNLGPRFFPWNVRLIWEFSKFNLSNEIAIRQLKNGTAQQAQNSARFCALPEAQGRAGSACGNIDQGGLLRTRNTRSMCFWLFLRPIYWDNGIPALQCDRWKWRSKLETNPMVAMVVLLLRFPTIHWGGFQELIDDMSIPWDPKSLEIADTLGKKRTFGKKTTFLWNMINML